MIEKQSAIDFYRHHIKNDEGLVLVLLFSTEGSTYQKAGAKILVALDGSSVGLISGGCLEPEIVHRSLKAWHEQKCCFWTIDTREDSHVFGYGLGCKGVLTLVFEPIHFTDRGSCRWLEILLGFQTEVTRIITVYNPGKHQLDRAFYNQGQWYITDGFPCSVNPENLLRQGLMVLNEVLQQEKQITILGAGTDALPLAKLCASLGWRTCVVDRSDMKISATTWPEGVRALVAPLDAQMEMIPDDSCQYVIIMTHNFGFDRYLLKEMAGKKSIPYIGLLGPGHRRDALLIDINGDDPDIAKQLEGRLFSPVGLPVGGRLPSEIALSIVSEIQACQQRSCLIPRKHKKISVVILAAGASKRLGYPKQLVKFRGKTLLRHAVDLGHQVANQGVYVVIGSASEEISQELTEQEVIVYNPSWSKGLSSSIKAGFKAAIPHKQHRTEHSVLFLLADQPLVTLDHLQALVTKARSSQTEITASQTATTVGVPAVFASSQKRNIDSLQGDRGCKSIILAEASISYVDLWGIDFDVDTAEDLMILDAMGDTQNSSP